MTDDSKSQAEALLDRLAELCKKNADEYQLLEPKIEVLKAGVNEIAPAWSGSWMGHHSGLYYEKFERPPPEHRFDMEWGTMRGLRGKWYEVTIDGIKEMVEARKGACKLDDLFEATKRQRKALEEIQEDLAIQFSPIRAIPGFEAEGALLDDLEKHTWGFSADDFAKHQMPKNYMTRDQRAMAEGIHAPPHIMFEANVLAAQSSFKANEEFCKKGRRLIRQTMQKEEIVGLGRTENIEGPAPGPLVQLCKRFHQMARQLRVRHGDRSTLEVNDEYDVQDLFHAALRLHFDDIRREDYTPSYAGGNSRVDFLLKTERTVVEIKKTRDGLNDKKLGEELIVDIARYQSHPNCDVLVCFVYDPEGRIGNPRGLESDLAKLGNDDLSVVVFIEPS